MEVTPISLRDVKVSSGVGAKPHGRDTSPHHKETQKLEVALAHREVPVNLAAERLAASLRIVDPNMDPRIAARIAKGLLDRDPSIKWESKEEQNINNKVIDVHM